MNIRERYDRFEYSQYIYILTDTAKQNNMNEKVIDLYENKKWSQSKLARNFDCSRPKIRKILTDNNVKIRSHKEQCNTEDFKNQLKDINTGKKLSETHKKAIRDGINSSEKFKKAMKIEAEKRKKDISDNKIKRLYERLGTCKEVSNHVDLSDAGIRDRLNKMGIDTSIDVWNKGKSLTEEHKKKLSQANKGKTWEEIFGKEHARWRRKNIGKKISKTKKGVPRSKETIVKLRKARIEEIKEKRCNGNQFFPSYNKSSISLIEEYGTKNGYSFQHAESGGEKYFSEIHCWVDGYDNEKGVVIEIYEPYHYKCDKLKEKDKKREKHILSCYGVSELHRIKIDKNNKITKTTILT